MTRLRFGICPTEGGRFFREALTEVERAEALRLRLRVAGRAPRRPRPLLARSDPDAPPRSPHGRRASSWAPTCASFPLYHPVARLAEETRAPRRRLERPAPRAGRRHRVQARRVPQLRRPREARGASLEEGLALMKALWTRDGVTHRAEHFMVVDGRIEPKAGPAAAPARMDRRVGGRDSPARCAVRPTPGPSSGPHRRHCRVSCAVRPRSSRTGGQPEAPPAPGPSGRSRESCASPRPSGKRASWPTGT